MCKVTSSTNICSSFVTHIQTLPIIVNLKANKKEVVLHITFQKKSIQNHYKLYYFKFLLHSICIHITEFNIFHCNIFSIWSEWDVDKIHNKIDSFLLTRRYFVHSKKAKYSSRPDNVISHQTTFIVRIIILISWSEVVSVFLQWKGFHLFFFLKLSNCLLDIA